jgi:hypothetical protein
MNMYHINPLRHIQLKEYKFQTEEAMEYFLLIYINLGRNITYYIFNREVYRFGILVLVVIKKYVQDYPEDTLKELQTNFPRTLYDNYELVEDISNPIE